MKIFDLSFDDDSYWVVAKSPENAREVFNRFAGNSRGNDAECRLMSAKDMECSYICNPNETEPDEGDPDFPDYDPDEWISGMRIEMTLAQYLSTATKPHVIDLD